jgi:hypothetical protein
MLSIMTVQRTYWFKEQICTCSSYVERNYELFLLIHGDIFNQPAVP